MRDMVGGSVVQRCSDNQHGKNPTMGSPNTAETRAPRPWYGIGANKSPSTTQKGLAKAKN